jgi:hypothetical protein
LLKQQAHRIRRLDAEFFSKQPSASLELAASFRPIALGQVDFDKSAMGGLSQWFEPKRSERSLYGVGMTAALAQSPGEALKCVEPRLAQSFPFILQPVVVPVRQQVADQVCQGHRVQVNGLRGGPRLAKTARERHHIVDVNLDGGIEPQERRRRSDHLLARLIHPPERGTQVRKRAFGRIVRPENSCYVEPPDCAIAQRQERDQALPARSDPQLLAALPKGEALY